VISGYEKYDYLFSNLKPHTIEGILIFGRDDDYIKSQKYDEVTNFENKIWADLYTNLELLLDQYASREYLLGIKALPIPRDRFPEFDAISPIVENSTGWTLLPVAGFLNEELFFEVNAKRQFPVTDIIRKSPRFDEKYADRDIRNDEGYTPEPDIFHDIQAHVPFLMNREYADFLADIGVLGHDIITDQQGLGPELVAHNLKRLQNFAWWTYEFGVVKNNGGTDNIRRSNNDIDYEIYGAGIISSYDETLNVVHCAQGSSNRSQFLLFDIEEIVMTRYDYSEIQDRYYVIDSMGDLYAAYYENKDLFFFEG
jgi:phenylalanine-4-hydroxylase|tara:strand:+ start:76 stop:1008 length:933 start_codon:yes stop_codon:yes gene_type:complete